MEIPIGIRSFERPLYTDITLRSVMSTIPHSNVVVLDDCSNLDVTNRYLFSNDVISRGEYDCDFSSVQVASEWKSAVGDLVSPDSIIGIHGKVSVIQPEEKRGDLGGVFWCVDRLFKDNPLVPGVILIEADMVFNAEWYSETIRCVAECKYAKGPNGNHLGLFSCYNRKGSKANCASGWQWRSLAPEGNTGRWRCGNGLGGVMFYVTREFYNSARDRFVKKYPMKRSGDTAIQGLCAANKFSIASTNYSCCQHIGVISSTWGSRKGWRHCRNFKKPFIMKDVI